MPERSTFWKRTTGASLHQNQRTKMLLEIFSVRDSKGDLYNQPFFQRNTAEATRTFTQLAMDEKSTLSQFPEDYDLYKIGTFDTDLGKINPQDTPLHIVKAAHVLNKN